jgi:hypothetical protein
MYGVHRGWGGWEVMLHGNAFAQFLYEPGDIHRTVGSAVGNSGASIGVSFFNGREPDENRADLDLARLDSISARLSFAPTSRLSMQVSAAHLHEAEAEFAPQPRSSGSRLTASATYHRPLGITGTWATTLAYGLNSGSSIIPGAVLEELTHGALLESSVRLLSGIRGSADWNSSASPHTIFTCTSTSRK